MASFFTMNFLTELLLSTVRMATPILLVALAETYSERAGMVKYRSGRHYGHLVLWWAFWWDMKQEVPGREF